MTQTLNFVGGGNMATAILTSAGIQENFAASAIYIAEPVAATRDKLTARGFNTVSSPAQLPASPTCFLCTKPQDLAAAAEQLHAGAALDNQPSFISICAGIPTSKLAALLNSDQVVRTMPNTPLLVNQGTTFAFTTLAQDHAAAKLCTQVFASCGIFHWVAAEEQLDAITALSGSGPAYVYLFIEALTTTAVEMGIEPAAAHAAATATVAGAAAMVTTSEFSPEQLRAQVTSSGGTTAAALAVFAQANFTEIIAAAMQAAKRRSEELAQE